MSLDPAWRGRRVLLTGHTGFKGAWLGLWLEQLGAIVTGFALEPPTEPSLFAHLSHARTLDSIIGDIRDLAAVEAAFERAAPEVVIHMAAQSLVRPSYDDPLRTYSTNVMGTANVLDVIRRRGGVRAAVIVTSDKCYENREQIWAYRETDPMGGHDPYSNSKGCAELVTQAFRASYFKAGGTAVATARAGNVIGGGDWAVDRLVPDAVRAFGQGRVLAVRNPAALRPWQHVLEPLFGYLILAEALLGPRAADFAQAWNFGPATDSEVPVSSLADELVRRWGEGAAWRVEGDTTGLHEARTLALDCTKARTQLRWQPALDLGEAVALTVDWFKACQAGADMRAFTLAQIDAYSAARRAT
ncbi:CDP-glucose 4,6-dehydratase [Ancylobacter sp.]|uniref:CDP-glucose 4,6-dehydratase n=1 Tax=Ancylobacter sp. TaxID=1872567 RepID=UPI003BA90960